MTIVTFNVNGHLYTFHLDRLERLIPKSLLTLLAKTDIQKEYDENGNIFLDLDYDIFDCIARYIRRDCEHIINYSCKRHCGHTLQWHNESQCGIESLKCDMSGRNHYNSHSDHLQLLIIEMLLFLNISIPDKLMQVSGDCYTTIESINSYKIDI